MPLDDHANDVAYRSRIAVLESEVRNLKESIALQAREYERRLGELNGERARECEDRVHLMTREVCAERHEKLDEWKAGIDTWRAGLIGTAFGIGLASGVVGSVLSALLMWLRLGR